MNNEVYRGREVVGFRCWTCGGVFDRMWGETCNHCRETERRHQELVSALKAQERPTP